MADGWALGPRQLHGGSMARRKRNCATPALGSARRPAAKHHASTGTMAHARLQGANATICATPWLASTMHCHHDCASACVQNPNWYDNEIGVPRQMGEIALLLGCSHGRGFANALSAADAAKMVEIMARADWKGGGTVSKPKWTGANLLDMLRIQLYRGLCTRSSSLVSQAFSRAFQDVQRHHQNEESIQQDNSFHQHGPQLLSAAYGAVFTADILGLADVSRGTSYQMPVPAVLVFEGLVLDGQAYMSRGSSWDWQVHGRGVSEGVKNGAGMMEISFDTAALRRFGNDVSVTRSKEWIRFADRIDSDDHGALKALQGSKCFFDSDYVAHNRPGFMFSVHMFSKRTIPAACVNSQGKLDRHLSDGATALYRTGHEYDGIFPVWNWSRPPGTTTASYAAAPACGNAKHSTKAEFVGSATDGTQSVAMQQLEGAPITYEVDIANQDPQDRCTTAGGITAGQICCLKSCGTCSGTGCSARPGGAGGCCSSDIKRLCGNGTMIKPPCRLGSAPIPSPSKWHHGPDARANKTWLLFRDAVVAMGDAEIPRIGELVTSVEQALLQGPVYYGIPTVPAQKSVQVQPGTTKQFDLSEADVWIWHSGVGYLLPRTAGVVAHLSTTVRSGSWSLLGVGSDELITLAVFDLFLTHGNTYRYLTKPLAGDPSELARSLENMDGYMLGGNRTSGYHASTDSTGAVLLATVWSNSTETLVKLRNWQVKSSRACAFVLHRWANGSMSASASVPGAHGGVLLLEVEGTGQRLPHREKKILVGNKNHATSCTSHQDGGFSIMFQLPSGDFCGSSVKIFCNRMATRPLGAGLH
eukprot:SAG31_NODE_720_length_12587_cov_15.393114_8_plen_815_part_00